jgi:flagellar basal-body rod protein FlgB
LQNILVIYAKVNERGNNPQATNGARETFARNATLMLSGIELFQVAGDRMRYLTERQTMIARNIANADTPGYKAQDLAPFTPTMGGGGANSTGGSSPLVLAQTNPGHLSLEPDTAVGQHIVVTDASYGGEKPNGNTVSVEEQMVKSADVANAFAMASAVYAKSISIMKIATGGR